MDMDTLIYDLNGGEFPTWEEPSLKEYEKKEEEIK